jgi:hypothetical protein
LNVDGVLVLEAQVVQIDVALGQQRERADGIQTPEGAGRVGDVVKDAGSVENWFAPPAVHLPVLPVQQQPRGVERQAQIWAVAHVNEPPRAVLHLLPPEPGSERIFLLAQRQNEVRERLVKAERVAVNVRARPADAPILQASYGLYEEPEVGAEVDVGVQQVALEEVLIVALRVGRRQPCIQVVVKLVALAHLAAERQIPVLAAPQRDVLDGVPEVGAAAGVFEVAVVLLVAQEFVGGRGRAVHRLLVGLAVRAAFRGSVRLLASLPLRALLFVSGGLRRACGGGSGPLRRGSRRAKSQHPQEGRSSAQ